MTRITRLWHVTVTVGGAPQDVADVEAGLWRLREQRPFLSSLRFDETRAEVSYWEESADMVDAASLALRLWTEHRASAGLPDWAVVGLEVLDRELFLAREETALDLAGREPHRF